MRPSFVDRFLSLLLGLNFVKSIEPMTAMAILGGGQILGSLISGNAAAKAQAATNAANERIANQTNQYNQNQYLLQRGFSTGQMPGIPVGATNTNLPLWATINGQPAEQALFNQILGIGQSGAINLSDPTSFASVKQTAEYLAANPEDLAGIQKMLTETGDPREPAQWLHDHVVQSAANEGGENNFTPKLKAFAEQTNSSIGTGVPAEYQALQDAAVNSAGRIYNGGFLTDEMNALAPALDARLRLGDLAMERNTELRGATKNIYDADLLKADTYQQAALEAVNRVMAQQNAKRALQGFSGGSSMDDLTAARTLAPAVQAGAGARAQAGVDYATRLSQILDADAKTVGENAKIQNAIDRLGLISGDINRQTGNLGLAGQLYNQQLSLEQTAQNQKYTGLDSMLARLNSLNTGGQVQTPSYTAPQVGSVLSSGQIAGSAISNLANMGMDYFTTQSLVNALKTNQLNAPAQTMTGYSAGSTVGSPYSATTAPAQTSPYGW